MASVSYHCMFWEGLWSWGVPQSLCITSAVTCPKLRGSPRHPWSTRSLLSFSFQPEAQRWKPIHHPQARKKPSAGRQGCYIFRENSLLVSPQVPLRRGDLHQPAGTKATVWLAHGELEREVKPTRGVGGHNQIETLGRRLVPRKNCVMENRRGKSRWVAWREGKDINTPTMCHTPKITALHTPLSYEVGTPATAGYPKGQQPEPQSLQQHQL